MHLKQGAVVADRFRLTQLLGKGGMGEVWAAHHVSLDIPCAVKFIHGESAEKPEVRARFEREAKAAAQLRSPHVVQILDYGIWETTPYIAMEYLEGEPLSALLKRRGRLDPHETFRIVSHVAKALTKAHAAGIVHRDLKPENVFLVPEEEGAVAKVLDFGVAKQTQALDNSTRTGALLGTPYYMSPEQAQGTKAVDHRADLWSLAVVTYRALTGELPFKSDALGDLLIKIVTHPIPVPSHANPQLPDAFDHWWARASQREAALRFQSAKELAQALGLALGVSVPTTLGNTPQPGLMSTLQRTQALGGTNAPTAVMPTPHGPPLPFIPPGMAPTPPHGMHAPGTTPVHPGMMGYGAPVPVQHGGHAQPMGAPQWHGPALGDSGASASVAGIATIPGVPKGGKKVALIGLLGAIVVVVGLGVFLVLRPGGDRAAASAASASAERAAPNTPPISSSAAAATTEPVATSAPIVASAQAESAPTAPAEAKGAPPKVAPPIPKPGPAPSGSAARTPKGPPTTLDVPRKPPPSKGHDFGF
jgi:serine/threonine-protein kinase